jgi:L-threonylcarbamoyladenylate synthase
MDRIEFDDIVKGVDAARNLRSVCDRILSGEVFIYPTETIYGIGGRADREDVARRIAKAKKRKFDRQIILLADDKNAFDKFDIEFPSAAQALAEGFWPGFLTLVLPRKNHNKTLGVRASNHPFVKAIYTLITVPIYSTSANMSDTEYKNDPEEIASTFSNSIDFMIDAGRLPPSAPSTIVSVSRENKVEILREGAILREDIESVLIKITNVR